MPTKRARLEPRAEATAADSSPGEAVAFSPTSPQQPAQCGACPATPLPAVHDNGLRGASGGSPGSPVGGAQDVPAETVQQRFYAASARAAEASAPREQRGAADVPAAAPTPGAPTPPEAAALAQLSPTVEALCALQQPTRVFHGVVAAHTRVTGQPLSQVYVAAREVALQHTLRRIVAALEAPPPPADPAAATATAKLTAGVSFVLRTESRQAGARGLPLLPHLVIRPQGLQDLPAGTPAVQSMASTLASSRTLAAVLPLLPSEENGMKAYLLDATAREELLRKAGGRAQVLDGVNALGPLLQDRTFLCLHYRLDRAAAGGLALRPCCAAPAPATAGGGAPQDGDGGGGVWGVAESDVQVGVLVRRGVGGTCPLRSAARALAGAGALDVLLDDAHPPPQAAVMGGQAPDGAARTPEKRDARARGPSEELAQRRDGAEGLPAAPAEERALPPPEQPPAVPLEQRLNMSTLSSRLEVYIAQATWDALSWHERCVLHSAIRLAERALLRHLAADSRGRLLAWARALQAAAGGEALDTPLGRALLAPLPSAALAAAGTDAAPGPGPPPAEATHCAAQQHPHPHGHPPQHQQHIYAIPPLSGPLDDRAAVVLAASCQAAAPHGVKPAAAAFPWPSYLIGTRDSFAHLLVPVQSRLEGGIVKTEWHFAPGDAPPGYAEALAAAAARAAAQRAAAAATGGAPAGLLGSGDDEADGAGVEDERAAVAAVVGALLAEVEGGEAAREGGPSAAAAAAGAGGPCLLPAGVTTYEGVFSPSELASIEADADSLDAAARAGRLAPACFQATHTQGGGLKRTKFFFGARYLWTHEQLAAPDAHVARGVRVDVPAVPGWMRAKVEAPLVAAAIAAPGFVDSAALNHYHTGTSGIGAHYDDAARFAQPILSLRLFSDSRLAFGTHLYGTNGAFATPMPRGGVTVLEAVGYAANAVKHCVRPADMTGKSAGMILRRINPAAMQRAREHLLHDTCRSMGRLSFEHRCTALLDASPTPALLPPRPTAPASAQQQPRPPFRWRFVSAATRQDVAKVVSSMVSAVERRVAAEERDALAVRLAAVRAQEQVERAARLGVDLSLPDSLPILNLLDGIVAWCERPPTGARPAARAAAGVKRPGRPAGGGGAARAVRRALDPELAAAAAVRQVLTRMVCHAEAVEMGRPRGAAAVQAARQSPALPGAAGAHAAMMVPPPRALLLAQLVASEALTGRAVTVPGGQAIAAEAAAAMQAVLKHFRLPSPAAMRQFLLAITGAGAGASASAAAAGNKLGGQSFTPMQYHAAVVCIARALCAVAAQAGAAQRPAGRAAAPAEA